MFKIKRKITGNVICIDAQQITYAVSFECIVKYSIFDFNIIYHTQLFKSVIEGVIRENVAKYKMKYFKRNVNDEFNKERDKWIDGIRTEESQRRIRDIITGILIIEADRFGFNLKKFQWIPCQQCHSLYAALS
jgi:adenine-specific DNA methylase